jgi:hypothetical protein
MSRQKTAQDAEIIALRAALAKLRQELTDLKKPRVDRK